MVSMSSDFSILSDNDDLPMGWVSSTVGDIGIIMSGQTPNDISSFSTENGEIPWFRVGNMNDIGNEIFLIKSDVNLDKVSAHKLGLHIRPAETIIFPKRGGAIATNKKRILGQPSAYDLNTMGILPIEISKKYFWYWFQSIDLNQLSNGSNVPQINHGDIEKLEIPLPPLNEQRRIVEKVEALMARSRRAKEALDAIPKLIEQFRQSVLAAAFRGDLTADWREQNPNIEPASVLLERIHEKRLELATTQRERSKVEAYYSKQENTTIEKFYNLPFNWEACRIQEIGNITNGSTPSRAVELYWEGNIPWVSSGEVRNNLITETRECITEQGYSNSSVKLLPKGTVLIAMIGEGKTRGQSSILQIEATINQNIAGILLNHNLVASEYLWYWLQYRYAINRIAGSGTGPQALNCQRVGEMQFILSPLEEQHEIVKRVKQIFQNLQIIQATSESVRENTNTLNQSILSKAFRGELVEQDPNDEPASVLLERIQKEREKEKTKVKQTGAKKLKK